MLHLPIRILGAAVNVEAKALFILPMLVSQVQH
jgi:hypothetical protein